MKSIENRQRPPRSLRKHIRQLKADLRRELGPQEATRAIDRELRRLRQSGGSS